MKKKGSYNQHHCLVWCIDVTGECITVATGGANPNHKIWDTKTGIVKHDICTETSVHSVNFKQDGSTLVMTICKYPNNVVCFT